MVRGVACGRVIRITDMDKAKNGSDVRARARRPRCDERHGMGASSSRRASRIVPVDRARYALGERPARARVLVSSSSTSER